MVDLSGYQIDSQAYPIRCPGCGSNQDYTDSNVEDDFKDVCFRCDKLLTDLPICANCRGYLDVDWKWCAWCRNTIYEQDHESTELEHPRHRPRRDDAHIESNALESLCPIDTPFFKVRNVTLGVDSRPSQFSYFDVLRGAFEQLVDRVSHSSERSRDSVTDDIVDAFIEMRDNYTTYGRRPEVKFHEERFRIAYLLYSTASNGYFTEYALTNDKQLNAWLNNKLSSDGEISVCTLGGGPGSEILGLAQWIIRQQFEKRIVITPSLTDRNSWIWEREAVKNSLDGWLMLTYGDDPFAWPLVLEQAAPATVDLRYPGTLSNIDDLIPNQDFFLFSYSLSELFQQYELTASIPVLSQLESNSKQSAKFLIVDRNQPTLRNLVKQFVDRSGMRILGHTDDNLEIISMPKKDSPKSLGNVFNRLKRRGHVPRTQGKVFWFVSEKRG